MGDVKSDCPLVMDIGSDTVRFGLAGEAVPTIVVPTAVGFARSNIGVEPIIFPLRFADKLDNVDVVPGITNTPSHEKNTNSICYDMQVINHIVDRLFLQDLYDFSSKDRPLLFTEPTHGFGDCKKELIELFFETHDVPSLLFSKQAALVTYAMGQTAAIVADLGASHFSTCWVSDGYVHPRTLRSSTWGGTAIDYWILSMLENATWPHADERFDRQNKTIWPKFVYKSSSENLGKTEYANTDATSILKCPHVLPSFMQAAKLDVARSLKVQICCSIPNSKSSKDDVAYEPSTKFQLPDGTDIPEALLCDIRKIFPECLFEPKKCLKENSKWTSILKSSSASELCKDVNLKRSSCCSTRKNSSRDQQNSFPSTSSIYPSINEACLLQSVGITEMIKMSMLSLFSSMTQITPKTYSILVTGGSSLFPNLVQRIRNEATLYKTQSWNSRSCNFKVIASDNLQARQYTAWIGGSIFGSLGIIPQIWMSKQDFDELGADLLIEKKCV